MHSSVDTLPALPYTPNSAPSQGNHFSAVLLLNVYSINFANFRPFASLLVRDDPAVTVWWWIRFFLSSSGCRGH